MFNEKPVVDSVTQTIYSHCFWVVSDQSAITIASFCIAINYLLDPQNGSNPPASLSSRPAFKCRANGIKSVETDSTLTQPSSKDLNQLARTLVAGGIRDR